jgi:Family of unknown function (DUF5677)
MGASDETMLLPTPEILGVTDLLESVIGRFLNAVASPPSSGKFESDDECYMLMGLVIRHVEGIVTLARRDLVLLPGAYVMARAAYEAALRILWILESEDPFAREVRWLAHMKEGEEYYKRMAGQFTRLGADASDWQRSYETIRDIRLAIEAKLPPPHAPLPKAPGVWQMVKELGVEEKYVLYTMSSQYIHGTHVATGLYRRHLGTMKEIGEFIRPQDWFPCLMISWYCLHAPGGRFLERNAGDVKGFLPEAFALEVQQALAKVERSPQ